MRKQRHPQSTPMLLRLFTYPQAMRRVPYLQSLVRSQRQHWLDMHSARAAIRKLDGRPGRPDRDAMIRRQELAQQAQLAEGQLEEAATELFDLGIFTADPACGLAMIPFAAGEELAWFVFDLFSPRGIEAWRFDADPIDVRRPLHQTNAACV